MSRTVEIIGRYEGERFRFNNPGGDSVIIGSVRLVNGSKEIAQEHGVKDPHGSLSIKGTEDETLEPYSTYRFLGTFSNYTNKRTGIAEKQFHFRTFVRHVPHDADGIAKYLVDCGRGNGIGPAKAGRLVQLFGVDDVLEKCRTEPELVATSIQISIELATRFAEKLEAQKATENAKLELDKLLTGKGFPRSLVSKLIKEWGNKAAAMLVEDPYLLMQFRGVGFRLADKLYMELGKDPAAIDRQALYLWYSMASDQGGNSWFPAEQKIKELQRTVGSHADYRSAVLRGKEFGKISEDHYGAIASIRTVGKEGPLQSDGSTLWLAEGKVASQELWLAQLVSSALNESQTQTLTIYRDMEIVEQIPATVARCNRCGRALTAEVVHVVDGLPYGPTCVEKI